MSWSVLDATSSSSRLLLRSRDDTDDDDDDTRSRGGDRSSLLTDGRDRTPSLDVPSVEGEPNLTS